MKTIVAIMLLTVLFGCSATQQQKTAEDKQKIIPVWVQKTPQSTDSFDVVVSQSITDSQEEARQKALDEGIELLRQQVLDSYQEVWGKDLAQRNQNYGVLETQIRTQARQRLEPAFLPAPVIKASYVDGEQKRLYLWMQHQKSDLASNFGQQLLKLDGDLKEYVHVSSAGSSLNQILSILPALPTLEARYRTAFYQQQLLPSGAKGPQSQLAKMMDGQLTRLFDSLVMSLNAQTEGSEKFENSLRQNMERQGFNVTARRPDLLMKYFFEEDATLEKGQVSMELVSDAELIDDQGNTFVALGQVYIGQGESEKLARENALKQFADELATKVVEATVQHMEKPGFQDNK